MIPTKITKRIEYWESKGLSKIKSRESKIWKETVEKIKWLIDGTNVFEGQTYTMHDFRKSVDCHAIKTLNTAYLPYKKITLKRINLSQFLYNPFAPGDFSTGFKHSLNSPPVPVNVKYPKIFDCLIKAYLRSAGNGIKTFDDLSQKDHSNLSWAANKIGTFCKNNMNKVDQTMAGTQEKIVNAFLGASLSFVKHDLTRLDTGLLTRKWVWEKFPNYLDQKGYLLSQQQFSIYN